MKPALGPAWRLKVRDNRAYVERCSDSRKVVSLVAPEAVALGLMDGKRELGNIEEVLFLMVGEKSPELLTALLNRLKPLLVDTPPQCTVLPSLDMLAAVIPPDNCLGLRPLPGPRTLHWWVTSYCPRRCVYCYAQPRLSSRAPDATISRERLREIFREASELGAENLLIGGAEPFLRPDLPEVMGDAVESGILPLLTTKHPISRAMAERLATAGVQHLSFSLDTADPHESHSLVGSAAWPEQVRRSAGYLRSAGVAFSIQAVASRFNLNALNGVAKIADDAGALSMQVVPFEPVTQPITLVNNKQMALTDPDHLDGEIGRIQEKFPGLRVDKFNELGKESRDGSQCDIGVSKLFFLPDGNVHRCYKLIHDHALCGKDLNCTSVVEAWHDPDFAPIITPRYEFYEGSACFDCGRFGDCHAEGRCIHEAFRNHGSYYCPDRQCRASVLQRLTS